MNENTKAPVEAAENVYVGPHNLPGLLTVPEEAQGLVLFAHGSGSSRLSTRNQYVAGVLQKAGVATLLFDLLDEAEAADRRKVFDIELLAERLFEAAQWVGGRPETRDLLRGYFGASTGAAAALVAAARHPTGIKAIVSRGGRPDLARDDLPAVQAPTLLIVGGNDEPVIEMNRQALALLRCHKDLVIIPGATHLFPEPGALEKVAGLARDWFVEHLRPGADEGDPGGANPGFHNAQFRDRQDAARRLATKLKELPLQSPLVLGIPRGGVATGATIAREIGADLDIVLSRKLRAPMQPELAMGAVGEDGRVYLTDEARELPGVTDEYLDQERRHQLEEIERRKRLFRSVRPAAPVADRSVIVVDDGIATGSTMIGALEVLKAQNPKELIVAVPVAPPSRLDAIRRRCDRLICLHAPEMFWAIGEFYDEFEAVQDEQVVEMLREFAEK